MYRRQCCRVPLPELSDALKALKHMDVAAAEAAAKREAKAPEQEVKAAQAAARKAASKAATEASKAGGYTCDEVRSLADCARCGWEVLMPICPVEWDDTKPASWKEWRPRIAADGKSYQQELQRVNGTRKAPPTPSQRVLQTS